MSEKRQDSQVAAMSIGDIYFIVFRHKWKILTLSLAGIVGAIYLLFVVRPPQFQSEALFSIRYVVEGRSLNPPGDEANTRPLDEQRSSIINTEIATLNSLDLARQVVQAMTAEKILARPGIAGQTNANLADQAAYLIRGGLTVEPVPESSVIRVTFQCPNAALTQPILSEIIDAYLMKHVQLHQGLGVPDNFLTNETVRLRAQLAQTDAELSKIKTAAGVVSVAETQRTYADQISGIRQDIFNAQAELAEHEAMLQGSRESAGTEQNTTNVASTVKAPSDQVEAYQGICILLASLRQKEQNYLTAQGFTTENVLVKQVHTRIVQYEALKKNLEEKYPALVALDIPVSNSLVPQSEGALFDVRTDSQQVMALKAKIQVLNSQLSQVWTEATNFDKVKSTISELEQQRDVESANLKYFMSNLEQSRIDDALGEDKAANISILQAPSPPVKGWSKNFKKKVTIVALGGVIAGLALAFFIELIWDRSVKRPIDIETKLRLPLFVSIPDLTRNGHRRLTTNASPLLLENANDDQHQAGVSPPEPGVDPADRRHPLRRYYEGLRDRLVVYFEVRNVPHKPKLIGVTSCARGAGVSSIASGLAASLSETGEGNVLLVDMNVEGGAAQHFHKGKPNCGLESALKTETKERALVQKNLYVATEPISAAALPQVLPKRFTALISKIRTSDYDYIIFDMPPVAETTTTFRAARLMDMMLLVIEAEKTNQDVAKKVISLLGEAEANVATVLNKTRSYVPAKLHQEFLSDI